jgi:UDP-2,3-diacylglucosamine pyrophosphatase LpxH
MAKNQAVVVSDVHIGNGAPTVWYQPAVHEAELVAVFDWVAQNAGTVRELVLLGDIFDIWTYPPSTRPPSLADIIAANPNTLGPNGALARAVAALDGAVTLMLGNHDGTLTATDIAGLSQSVGKLNFEPGAVHVLQGSSGARTAFAHGHYWTMFNAPDQRSPWKTLPVGHFVTRAFAFEMANTLKPGQTVADLANMGAPNGFDLGQFLLTWQPTLNPSLAAMLLDYCAGVAKMPGNLPITLPDGSVTSIDEAKRVYANLFTQWAADQGGPYNAMRAALADQWGDYLAWFAQQTAIRYNADLIVMGHTHTPIGGLTVSPVNYFNNGFECPSKPDVPPKEFTFTIVDLDHASAEIFQVTRAGGNTQIQPFTARVIPPIPPPAEDFSCYISIENRTSAALQRDGGVPTPGNGYWVVEPPGEVPPGQRVRLWLQDNPGPHGSDATVKYRSGGNRYAFGFDCPTGVWPNSASGPNNNFIARAGTGGWGSVGSVPRWGHPLQVRFTVT